MPISHTNLASGLYFQIRDDYCNLSLKEYSENKSFCEDLTEGKFSFPMIHAIQTQNNNNQVLRKYSRDFCRFLKANLLSSEYLRFNKKISATQ